MREMRSYGRSPYLALLVLVLGLLVVPSALAVEQPPYEFDATLSLTGNCSTKNDPVPDPGCPEKKPPQSFTKPSSIGVDSFGDEYVASYGAEEGKKGRIDIFSPKGVYIAEVKDEFGPKNVAVDSKGTLYVFDQSPGHQAEFARYKPKAYEPAEEKIEYGAREPIATEPGPSEGGLAIDSNDHVFVDWPNIGIKEYSSAAEGNSLLETITNGRLYASTFIALDKQRRRLYASSCPNKDINECWVLAFNADKPHELLEEIKNPNSPSGKFASGKGWTSIAVVEESGDFFVGDLELQSTVYQFNKDYEFLSLLSLPSTLFPAKGSGEPLQIAVSNAPMGTANRNFLFVPSPENRALAFSPPKEQPAKVKSVSVTAIGEEEAELLATVEPKGGKTTYVFEYLSQQAYEKAGNSFEGAVVAGEGTVQPTEQEAEVSAPISGLEPSTAYRFRISVKNEAGGEAKEATFTTYNDASGTNSCENQALRTGYSALLPDCRAYELVTPADTGGQPPTGTNFAGENFPTVKASPDGNVISFITHGGAIPGLGGTGSYNGDLYRTVRSKTGWSTESAGPTGAETTSADQGGNSPDQGYSFWTATREGSAVVEGQDTRYVRYPDGHSALIGRGDFGTDPRARGKLITENGTHIIFVSSGVVYDRTSDEVTHIVSQLPGNPEAAAGEYVGASADGEGVAFLHGSKLYLRVGNATTYEIGENVEFAGVSEGGSRIFYVEGGDLFAFDTESEEAIPFAETGNATPVNVASDGTRAYFVSTTAIESSGESPNGATAEAGEENLYLSEEGVIRFVGTVTKRDVEGESNPKFVTRVDGLGLWTVGLLAGSFAADPSRATPNGSVLLFSSRANLDGYAHEGVPEIYRYDSTGNRLHCVSCIPTKTPAEAGASLQTLFPAEITAPLGASGFVRNLRDDGRQAIFESTEALVSRDNDKLKDVYEWEDQGVGSCTRPGGCVYLISSGSSPKNNYLYGISNSGNDVFFTTVDVLVNGDNDTLSIYDARVNGGFPQASKKPCEGEGCKPDITPAPPLPPPVTGPVGKSGNVTPPKHCPKGKHKAIRNGQEVCVKKKKHHKKHNKTKKGAGK